jgi:hypothetical protein
MKDIHIGKEEIRSPLLAENMIVYIENTQSLIKTSKP